MLRSALQHIAVDRGIPTRNAVSNGSRDGAAKACDTSFAYSACNFDSTQIESHIG